MQEQQENSTPQPPVQGNAVSTTDVTEKRSPKKIIIALVSVILLVCAVVAGVVLVRRQQEIRERASSAAECSHSPDCVVFDNPGNSGFREVDRHVSYLYITNKPGEEARFEPNGGDNGCYRVEINNNQVRWDRYGSGNTCRDISNIQVWLGNPPEPTATPTPSPTPPPPTSCNQSCTSSSNCADGLECIGELCRNPICSGEQSCNCPEPTPTPTDIPPDISAVCNQVVVYDTSWNQLSPNDLKQLSPGDNIRFAVSGNTTQGTIDKARFVINGVTSQEVTGKKPGTDEYYIDYQVPQGQLNFNVTGQIYHSTLGWF